MIPVGIFQLGVTYDSMILISFLFSSKIGLLYYFGAFACFVAAVCAINYISGKYRVREL